MRLIGLALALSLVLMPLAVEGQQAGKVYRIGVLSLERFVARVDRFVSVAGWPWRALRRVLRKAWPDA